MKALNIGVLCRPKGLLAYQEKALSLLSERPVRLSFCFHLFLRSEDGNPQTPPQLSQDVRRLLVRHLLGKTEMERRVAVPPLPKLPLKARREGRHSVYLLAESQALLRSLQLDVLINFTNHILRGEILTLPRYGVWSYHHGDPHHFRGYPPGFWEIYHGAPTTGAVLQRLNHRLDDGVIMKKAIFPTLHDSYYRQREKLFSLSVPWLAEVATEISRGNPPVTEKPLGSPVGPIYTRPTHMELGKFLLILLRNKIRKVTAR